MSYKPALDLSRFKNQKRELTEEQMDAAIKAASKRYMEPEILHDVRVSGIVEKSVKLNENNPNWMQFGMILENASGEIATHYVMVPLGTDLTFIARNGNPTTAPLQSYGLFQTVMGFQGLSNAFVDKIISTDCEILEGLIGFQCRYIAKWSKNKYHPIYDPETQAWYAANSKGEVVLSEPFQIPGKDEVESISERWGEMALQVKEQLEGDLEYSANGSIQSLPGIVNPIHQLGLSYDKGAEQAEEKAKEQAKPRTATVRTPAKSVVKKPTPKVTQPPPPPVEEDEGEDVDPTEFDTEELEVE